MIRVLNANEGTRVLQRRTLRLTQAEKVVRPILYAVRTRGDRAVLNYARVFDGFQGKDLRIPESELRAARRRLDPQLRQAIEQAAENIRAYARLQLPEEKRVTLAPGIKLGQIVRPLDSVAAYIPGGRYPLPSTLMMTVIPAQVAGVPNICVACPSPSDVVLGTAALLGVQHVFQVGGAQAIAAFAYGTRTIPKVDRIVGPGNIYVTAAKKLLAAEVGIDFIAGPSEIVIIADDGDPRWIAADMLAQAEHDVDACAILLTTSRPLAEAVQKELETQLQDLPTAPVARRALEKNGAIIVVPSLEKAVELANEFAPEHLTIPDAKLLKLVRHAGSIFIGPTSPEAAGDYAAGPNHVLPTAGAARLRGGLSAADFVKVITYQELSPKGLARLAPAITRLARSEGLEAHARSVEVRLEGNHR